MPVSQARAPHDLAYLPRALFRQGEALERLGRVREARARFVRVLGLWRDAEPEFGPAREAVARRVAALGD